MQRSLRSQLILSNADNVYTPPHVLSKDDIPAGVLNYLNGEDLLSKTAMFSASVEPKCAGGSERNMRPNRP
jgi:hypothetical protein